MENQVITYTDYKKYKEELDTELQKSAESFVKIGYLLKVARDTNILRDSGYANVNEFAQKEYGLDKTQVSRFIHINDKFSEDGYSERLKAEYRGYGYAKLSIMLLLPEAVNNMISPTYSKSEIQAIKEEVDEEKKVSDIEVMLEHKDEMQQAMETNLEKAVNQMGRDMPELYVELFAACANGENVQCLKEILAPSGEKMYSVRIAGVGRMMLSVKENEDRVVLANVRTGEMEEYSWEDMVQALTVNMDPLKSPEESWETMYGQAYPKKEEVAPVQQEEKKPVPRKESKVVKAKVEEPEEEQKQPEEQPKKHELAEKVEKYREEHPEEAKKWDEEKQVRQENQMQQDKQDAEEQVTEAESQTEPQVEGQTDIYDHPEYLPEGMEKPEEQPAPQRSEKHQTMLDTVIEIQSLIVKKDYSTAKKKTQELLWYLDQEA